MGGGERTTNGILPMAEEMKYDPTAMGTHGLSGHVVDVVVKRAACAVLTKRRPFPEQGPPQP